MGGNKQGKKPTKKTPKAESASERSSDSHRGSQNNDVLLQRPWATHAQDLNNRLQQQDWRRGTPPYDGGSMSGYIRQSLIDEPYQAIHSVRSQPTGYTSSNNPAERSEAGATSGSK